MKRIILILVVALLPVAANAQYIGGAKYMDIKNTYNYKEYMPSQVDPYSPGLNGAWSFFIPGIGQMLTGEVWRGLAFFGGAVVCSSIFEDAYSDLGKQIIIDEANNKVYWSNREKGQKDLWILGITTAVDLGIAIWSDIDARRIAKVKNMYYQDQIGRRSAIDMNFAPSLAITHNGKPAAGMGLTINF